MCDPAMTLVVDDSADVWGDNLQNLCLVRRFVGDAADDGLSQLSTHLRNVHNLYYSPRLATSSLAVAHQTFETYSQGYGGAFLTGAPLRSLEVRSSNAATCMYVCICVRYVCTWSPESF